MFYFNIMWLIGDLKYVWNDDIYGLEKYALYKTEKCERTNYYINHL